MWVLDGIQPQGGVPLVRNKVLMKCAQIGMDGPALALAWD